MGVLGKRTFEAFGQDKPPGIVHGAVEEVANDDQKEAGQHQGVVGD